MTQPMEWQDRAACRGLDPTAFFLRGADRSRRAVRVCERCQVREECLRYALDNEVEFGVWGGMTERQRRALKRSIAS